MNACIYTIAKNELDHVEQYMNAADNAGLPVYILDTGSTDDTVERFRKRGADVWTANIEPWRFDNARNINLAMIPGNIDWCLSLDLDEVLDVSAWMKLKKELDAQTDKFTRVQYLYAAAPGRFVYNDKLHARHVYNWHWPVHEALQPVNGLEEKILKTEYNLIAHFPRDGRHRSYAKELAYWIKRDEACSQDERMWLLLGRDSYNDKDYSTSKIAFETASASAITNPLSRVYTLCMLAKICVKTGTNEHNEEIDWLKTSSSIMPRRETLVDLADAYQRKGEYLLGFSTATRALKISDGQYWPHSDPAAWGYKPLEIASICAYYMGRFEAAKTYGKSALAAATDPRDIQRIKENLRNIRIELCKHQKH